MVDDGLQQFAIAHDLIVLIGIVIFVDVVAFLVVLIEGVVSVAFPDNFFVAVKEMLAPVIFVLDQIFAALLIIAKLLHCFIKFAVESVLVCIVCQKSIFFCYD